MFQQEEEEIKEMSRCVWINFGEIGEEGRWKEEVLLLLTFFQCQESPFLGEGIHKMILITCLDINLQYKNVVVKVKS